MLSESPQSNKRLLKSDGKDNGSKCEDVISRLVLLEIELPSGLEVATL
jgi:hypothetical protein